MSNKADSSTSAGKRGAMISVEQARAYLLERARVVEEIEATDLTLTLGRMLAVTQVAEIDVPGFDNSSMDGFAIRSADASRPGRCELGVVQRITAGQTGRELRPGEAARIFTGAPMPPGADAVVMQEDASVVDGRLSFEAPVAPGQHVRPRGNNITAGSEVLSKGTRLRPQEMGLAAAVGIASLPVYRRLKVAIFSSGDELVAPGASLASGQIYNSNRYTLLGLLQSLGCELVDLGIVPDRLEATCEQLEHAARQADVIVTSGGVSVGEEDHLKTALERVGRLEMWRVAVKPGKPLTYGRIGTADFLGLPGNPVSTLITYCLFVRPFLLTRAGAEDVLPQFLTVKAGFEWPTPMRRREYVRARIEETDGEHNALLFPKQGSDVLASTVWAQGLVEIPEHVSVAPGDRVRYLSFAELLY